jgi:hypothetical protein
MSKILEAAARRLCLTCDGTRELDGQHASGEVYQIPCPGCRDSNGQPTGLWVPELTVECEGAVDEWQEDDWEIDGEDYYIVPDVVSTRTYNIGPVMVVKSIPCNPECVSCGGTGRVLSLTSDSIDGAMERLGWTNTHCTKRTDGFWWEYEHENWEVLRDVCCFASTRSAARIAAAAAVVKVAWPEVEHDG